MNDLSPAPVSLNDAERLRHLRDEARAAAGRDNGDFVEMGVFRGGSAVLLARELARAGSRRTLHLLDSWEGPLPTTSEDAGAHLATGRLGATDDTLREILGNASEEEVRALLERLGLLPFCRTYRGYFHETLSAVAGPFALAHVDSDFYRPVGECLDHVLPRMAPGGVVVVDDYGTPELRRFPGVARAVAERIAGTAWCVVPLGGAIDASVKLVREEAPGPGHPPVTPSTASGRCDGGNP